MSHEITIPMILLILSGVVGILADAAIIYAIFRFKRIRTIPNIFLANWAIADLLSIVWVPLNFVLIISGGSSFHAYTCLLIHATLILHVAVVLFALLLAIDWCAAAYFQRASEKIRKHFTLLIAAWWIFVALLYSLSSGLCIGHVLYYFSVILFILFYVLVVLFVLALLLIIIIQKLRMGSISQPKPLTTRFILISVITFSYMFAVISTILTYLEVMDPIFYSSTLLYIFISMFSVFSSSTVTLTLLCCLDRNFRLCLIPLTSSTHENFENEYSEAEEDHTKNNTQNSTGNLISNSAS